MDGTIQSVVRIQDPTSNGCASGVQIGASETREGCGVCDTVDYRLMSITAVVVRTRCSGKLTQLETGDEQHHGNFETDLGDIPTRFLVD